MKTTLSPGKRLLVQAFLNEQLMQPLILRALKIRRKALLMGVFVSIVLWSPSFSQEATTLLSRYDSCHVHPPQEMKPQAGLRTATSNALVRLAYVIPSNRTPQPNGVRNFQNVIKKEQQWYKEQMEQNGFGAKTFTVETEDDGVTPLVHVVHVPETDDFLRGDGDGYTIWARTMTAASDAGVSLWAIGEVWVLIPEVHLMLPDGTVTGEVALGAGWGTSNRPGLAMIGSKALALFEPDLMTNDTPYDGQILPAIGPFPMRSGNTFGWYEGTTISAVVSSWLGALFHEMGHAFGLAHDFRNDNNFHGNLMGNGLRGIRGSLFPEKYPQDYTRLEYTSALILNVSHFFNNDKYETFSPAISFANPGSISPKQGLVHIAFQATDDDSLSLAHLRYNGNAVAEILLDGTEADTALAVPYFTPGNTNQYTLALHDRQGNTTYREIQFNVPAGYNQAPIPFIQVDPPVPGVKQPIRLDASHSSDADHSLSSVVASWDVDNDGQFDTEPNTNKVAQYLYENPGNYLIRLKLTDPDGAQTISTPVSVRIPGEKKITVEGFTLIDADKDTAVADLHNGTVIDLTRWEGKKFSVRANASPGVIAYVKFDLKGPIAYHGIEKAEPYALFGDSPKGNFVGRKLLPGEYTLTVTPFAASGQGIALTISFQVVPGTTVPSIVKDKTIGGAGVDQLNSVVRSPDGGYLLAGSSSSNISGDKSESNEGFADFWVVKVDAQYNKQWDKTFGGENNETLQTAIPANNGGYLLAGLSSDSFGNEIDYWIIMVDDQGNKVWDKTFGGVGRNILRTAISIPGGGYLLGGDSEANASGDKSENSRGESDYWIIRIDNQGNKIWDKTIGGGGEDLLRGITAAPDGGWLLGGLSMSDASGEKSENGKGSVDYWIVKIDDSGNRVWDKTIGGTGHDSFSSAEQAVDGGYLLAGSSDSDISGDKREASKGNGDFWLVKIDSQGGFQWDKTIGGDSRDTFSHAIPTADGGYLLGGTSNSDISGDKTENSKGNDDYWVVKLDATGNRVWDKTIGGSVGDNLASITPKLNDNYLLAGSSNSNASGDKSENVKGNCGGTFCASDYWIVELTPPTRPVVTSLTLMNAYTDQEIKEIKDGDVISLTELGTTLLNIRANVSGEKIGRVVFDLNGPITYQHTEIEQPYALFGDSPKGNFFGRKLLPGKYSLSVATYVNDTKAATLTISFTVIQGFEISGFTLIDATTDQPVRNLTNHDVIDLSLFKGHRLSAQADTKPGQLEKVILVLGGPIVHSTTEHYYPYNLFGDLTAKDGSADYGGAIFLPGTYNLTAIPFLDGVRGTSYTISFTAKWGDGGETAGARLEVYPNPASRVAYVKPSGRTEQANMILLDVNGNTLLNRPLSEQPVEQLDVSTYRRGIYYLKIVTADGTQTVRLVIE